MLDWEYLKQRNASLVDKGVSGTSQTQNQSFGSIPSSTLSRDVSGLPLGHFTPSGLGLQQLPSTSPSAGVWESRPQQMYSQQLPPHLQAPGGWLRGESTSVDQ